MDKLPSTFFQQDVLELAPLLLGKKLVRVLDSGEIAEYIISELEVYRGEEDTACHASKGKTTRTEVMYSEGGVLYVYLIYGMYWMLNIVTGPANNPQAILIRGLEGVNGPGKVGKLLLLDMSFNGEDLAASNRIWIEDMPTVDSYKTSTRIGIDYASEEWRLKPWRYILNKK